MKTETKNICDANRCIATMQDPTWRTGMSKQKDTLFSQPLDLINGFKFDKQVVDVFPDMIKRSVPGYSTIVNMIAQLSKRYAQNSSNCYDLGCSLGASTLAMRQAISAKEVRIIAIDNSEEMILSCQRILDRDNSAIAVDLYQDDIQAVPIERASIVVLNFTLQFVPIRQRLNLLKKIYEGMLPGGIVLISEKVKFEQAQHNELMISLHHDFKKNNGYSDLEIAQKRSALENVLVPETLAAHKERIKDSGFASIDVWFQCFNFASLIAIK